MLPSFFDSVLQLIVRTSTDLPPDVRAAMKHALVAEPPATRSSQALTIIAQNIDLAVDNEGAICQDTGMPTFEVKTPVGANQIWMRRQIREAVAEATRRGKLRPNSVDSITGQELRRQPRAGHADHPFRSMGTRRDRNQVDPEGRRLREHERAVRAAGGASAPWTRGSHARRREEMHPARGLEGAGQGLRAGRGRRLRRRRPHVRLHAREGTAVPHARRHQSGSASGGDRGVGHVDGRTISRSARWDSAER